MSLLRQISLLCFAAALSILGGTYASAEEAGHPGPVISAWVERGDVRLPVYQVAHLNKGDRFLVTVDRDAKFSGKWLLVLATVSSSGDKVESSKFDLSNTNDSGAIEIKADNEIPVIVLAPQVHTLFGLSTSFNQSAKLITDAIASDPQQFVDLQKIDQINHAIATITGTLDAAIQSQKPEDAVESAKSLAAKFGAKNIDPDCFKGNTVNTKCVATSIVSNKDLTVPSIDELGSLVGPIATADLSEQMLANIRLVSAASAFLANKYRDQYEFAPSSGQKRRSGNQIQLFANTRFKNGRTKTAYVYVPSWFAGDPPQMTIDGDMPACLSAGELKVKFNGSLPVNNYWHDWKLMLREPGSSAILAQSDDISFNPENGLFSFYFGKISKTLPSNGQLLDAAIVGNFGFASATAPTFKVALPTADSLQDQIAGLDNLVSGERTRIRFTGPGKGTCITSVSLLSNGNNVAASTKDQHDKFDLDLNGTAPGDAQLQIAQYGVPLQTLPVQIKKRKAHIDHIEHFDLENEITVYGDNLQRIDSIQADHVICHAPAIADPQTLSTKRIFSCPSDISDNEHFPAQVTIVHLEQQPASFDVPVTKLNARPHMTTDGSHSSITTLLSAKAIQWGLTGDAQLLTDDSSLSLLLHAFDGYQVAPGTYNLQIKFAEDPETEKTPISVPLIANRVHNELRTRTPISFANVPLPNIVNPIWYRVQHQQTGLVGDWQALNRSVVTLPVLGDISCNSGSSGYLIHGSELDQIDWVSSDLTRTASPASNTGSDDSSIKQCGKGLCIATDHFSPDHRLRIKVHWIDDRLFDVTFPETPACVVPAK